MIRTLVISESVFQTFNHFAPSKSIDLRSFWKHSLKAAVIARLVAKKMGYPNIDEAYLAGLLHDIGRLALLAVAPDEYAFHFHSPDDESLCAAEQRILQITHAEAGSWLIERWRLDSFIADSLLYHHEPVSRIEAAHPLIRIVYLAHSLACHEHIDPAIELTVSRCGIEAGDLPSIMEGLAEKVQDAADFLGVTLDDIDEAPKPDVPVAQDPAQDRLNTEIQNLFQASELGRYFSTLQSESALRKAVCQSAHAFFHLESAFLLLRDEKDDTLRAHPANASQQRLSDFSIPPGKESPIAEAATQRRLAFISPADAKVGIAEEQLLRMLGSERLVCIPLSSADHCAGMLIGGAAAWQVKDLQQNQRMLKSFGTQAAIAMKNLAAKPDLAQGRIAHLEEQYRDSSRRVAHEVNNPLSIIKNYLRVLDDKMARKEPISGEMSILNEELDRVGQIINGFAGHATAPSNDTTDMNRVIDQVVRLFRDTEFAPRNVRIVARMQGKPCAVWPVLPIFSSRYWLTWSRTRSRRSRAKARSRS